MNNHASAAMLKGLTSQLMLTVTAMPRHCSATRCSALTGINAADLIDLALRCHAVELVDRQRDKELDAAFECAQRVAERVAPLDLRSLDRAGSGTPQCAVMGLPGQIGADLAGSLI